MDDTQPTSDRGAGASAQATRGFDRSVLMLVAGAVALALVVAFMIGTRVGSTEAASPGSPQGQAAGADPEQQDQQEDGPARDEDPADAEATEEQPEPSAAELPDAPLPTPRGDLPPIQGPADRGMLHVSPVSVTIPAIDVSSSLVDLGLNPDNSLEVPTDYSLAGWYTEGAYPGDAGGPPALIVGHVDNSEGPAVFYDLKELEEGDEILVERADGSTAVFIVYDAQQYPKTGLPTEEIYAEREGSELVLITCTGDFDSAAGSYLDNYVVTARLDRERSGLDA